MNEDLNHFIRTGIDSCTMLGITVKQVPIFAPYVVKDATIRITVSGFVLGFYNRLLPETRSDMTREL